jgi:hypothetical protein
MPTTPGTPRETSPAVRWAHTGQTTDGAGAGTARYVDVRPIVATLADDAPPCERATFVSIGIPT